MRFWCLLHHFCSSVCWFLKCKGALVQQRNLNWKFVVWYANYPQGCESHHGRIHKRVWNVQNLWCLHNIAVFHWDYRNGRLFFICICLHTQSLLAFMVWELVCICKVPSILTLKPTETCSRKCTQTFVGAHDFEGKYSEVIAMISQYAFWIMPQHESLSYLSMIYPFSQLI